MHYMNSGWKEGRNPSPYFYTSYYLKKNSDILESGTDPLRHYINFGWKVGRNPSPYFYTSYYLKKNSDILESGIDPLRHYINVGWKEGRNPSPYFYTNYYLETNSDILKSGINPLLHYINSGWKEGRKPSPYFDTKYYLENNPDAVEKFETPLLHYIESGWKKCRNPSVYFDINYYLTAYPDISESADDPLLHYINVGWKEGRNPSPYFDTKYYLRNNPDVDKSWEEPLSHYIKIGWREGRHPFAYFDPLYYLDNNPDIAVSGWESLSHYIKIGWRKGLSPSAYFDINYYNKNNPDIAALGSDPLLHYINFGMYEGRKANKYDQLLAADQNFYEAKNPYASSLFVKVIAFYLPQFHPIPENNEWWGEGFTEWTNVSKAKPLFKGHHQPQLPDAMGFYDLRLPEIMEKQARVAKEFGIHGFCFYHYYFSGKRLLEQPVDTFLEHPEIDINFCLCWANENWTRRWDGQENEVLIAQGHTPEDDIRFLEDIEKYFEDSRYITIEGKPVLIIYRPALFPDMKATIKRWREHRKKKNKEDIYIVMALTFGDIDPLKYGFDAGVEFPPHDAMANEELAKLPHPVINIKTLTSDTDSVDNFAGQIFDYNTIIDRYPVKENNYPIFKTAFPSWDNTARRGTNASLFFGGSPEDYYSWILRNIKYSYDKLPVSSCFTFINAWNEWGEGAHLEPDRKYGYAFLNATSKALTAAEAWAKNHRSLVNDFDTGSEYLSREVLVIIHLYHMDLIEDIVRCLKNIPCNFDICISSDPSDLDEIKNVFTDNFPQSKVTVKCVVNLGYDIAPFVITFREEIMQYPLVCKIHGNELNHDMDIDTWRHHGLGNLLGSKYIINDILNAFYTNENLGILSPVQLGSVLSEGSWGNNYDNARKWLKKMRFPDILLKEIEFSSGSMFWFKPAAMHKLFECGLTYNDFIHSMDMPPNGRNKVVDGTLAQMINQIFVGLVRSQGFENKVIDYSSARYELSDEQMQEFCPVCEKNTVFFADADWLRDHYKCLNCQSLPRDRQLFKTLHEKVPNWKNLKTIEFAPCNDYLKNRIKNYTGSQYYPDDKFGSIVEGFNNQDAENMTFPADSYDLVVHLDIMEHLFNPDRAIQEMLRVVRPGGHIVFSVPIKKDIETSLVRAKLKENGEIDYLLDPEYHGNPVSDEGSLVTWDYGNDFCNLLEEWGKAYNVKIELLNKEDINQGIEGEYLDCILISKQK